MIHEETNSELARLKEINQNIEVIIALLLKVISRENDELSLKEQIAILDSLGVRPIAIARVVGRTPGHINKELVAIRKTAKRIKQ